MEKISQITSIDVISANFNQFKAETKHLKSINLKKLLNRSLDLYLTDPSFKELIDNYNTLNKFGDY